MTRIIIRAVRDRTEFIVYLQSRLPQAEWCFDKTRNAMDTFLSAMEMAGDEPAVHMEEDVILTRGFVEKLEAAIAERPHEVIQFFSMRKADLTIGSRYDGNFMMNQCFYLPAGMSRKLLEFRPEWKQADKHPTGFDILMADYFKSVRLKYWLHVPSLVEHRVCKSMIDPRRSSKRQSLTFEDPWE